jgi:hypothetical protein
MSDFERKGHIREVFYGPCDRAPELLTCSVYINFDSGTQGFGNLALDSTTGPDFRRTLLETFDVADMERLVGLPCIIYRCFSHWNATIDAIGPADRRSKKFVLYQWARKFFPETPSPLEAKTREIEQRISSASRRIEEDKLMLVRVQSEYRPIE